MPGWATQVLVWVIFSFVVFSVGTVPIRADNDCWWHVKSGKFIVENGLPEKDVFTYTAADTEWHNHEWLAQVIFYKVYQAGDASGFGGLARAHPVLCLRVCGRHTRSCSGCRRG
jgi:hypothetical protein